MAEKVVDMGGFQRITFARQDAEPGEPGGFVSAREVRTLLATGVTLTPDHPVAPYHQSTGTDLNVNNKN